MRKIVKSAWETAIISEVKSNFPKFSEQSKSSGVIKFLWHAKPSLWCILAFRSLDDEAFDAFAGWSTKKNLPFAKYFDSDPSELNNFEKDFFITWTLNYVPRDGLSYWKFWEPPEEALDDPELFFLLDSEHYEKKLSADEAEELVSKSIKLSIDEIKKYCIPYLNKRVSFDK